jgi:hypothetical protein
MSANAAHSYRTSPDACAASPHWLEGCAADIDQLVGLEENWNSYGARKVDPRSIEFAKRLIVDLANMSGDIACPQVAASPDGNVALSWQWHDHSRELNVEITPDGTIRYSYIDEEDSSRDAEGETDDPHLIARLRTQW